MLSKVDELFQRREINPAKLLQFGFCKENKNYTYSTNIMDGQFQMTMTIAKDGAIQTRLVELETDEEYVLHRTVEAYGPFVGAVRTEYEKVLCGISETCFELNVFKNDYAKEVIQYVRDTYQDELEFLWPRTPNNAIWRRKDTGKWYCALLVLSRRKLGLDSDETIEILDLRAPVEEIKTLVDGKKFFPGYHMNKKHWITICLDGSVSMDEIKTYIETSYQLAIK